MARREGTSSDAEKGEGVALVRHRRWGETGRVAACAAIVAAAVTATSEANADPLSLRYDATADGAVVAASVSAMAVIELAKGQLASTCSVCRPDALDASVRNAWVWGDHTSLADDLSWVSFASVFALGIGAEAGAGGRGGGDLLVIAEATALDGLVNQVVKVVVARQRPFVYYAGAGRPAAADDNVSFFSGHTSLSMAAAVATSTVASLRGYGWAPLAWATLPPLSLLTGYLRIAADKHYLTDVLAGALVGAGIGLLVPLAFHRGDGRALDAAAPSGSTPAPPTASVLFRW